MDRRSLIIGGVALIAAPAIVRAEWLMPVKPIMTLEDARLEWRRYMEKMSYVQPMIFLDFGWWTPEEALNGWIRNERKNDLSS